MRLLLSATAAALFLTAPLTGCAPAPSPSNMSQIKPPSGAPAGEEVDDQKAIARVLDDWHDAAAKADEKRYFDHLTEEAVFLGTDITERWDKKAFRAYSHPHFAKPISTFSTGKAFHAKAISSNWVWCIRSSKNPAPGMPIQVKKLVKEKRML